MCFLESPDACVIRRILAGPLVAGGPLQVASFLYRAGMDGPCTTVSSHFSLFSYFFISNFPYGHVREEEGK